MRFMIMAASFAAIAFSQTPGTCFPKDATPGDGKACTDWCCNKQECNSDGKCTSDAAFESATPAIFEPQCQENGGACETSHDCCGDIDMFCIDLVCAAEHELIQ